MLSQKVEECKQMKQDLQRAQSLFSSAERELRYEKEKNLDLKRHNSLLDQEKLKVRTHIHTQQGGPIFAKLQAHNEEIYNK